MKTVSVRVEDARISFKSSLIICQELKGKKVEKAKKLLENLINKKISLRKRYYTNTAKKILELLDNVESNARFKGLNPEKLFIKNIKVDKGSKFIRPKSRWRFRGRKAKATNIKVVIEER